MSNRLGSWFYSLTQFLVTFLTLLLLFFGAIEIFHLAQFGSLVNPVSWLWRGIQLYVIGHPFLHNR
ncbi:MAG: hypothetical protein K0041_06985 [Acidithiobacillus sp.]|nr:hypothetical protein [Acidithiobacillus sp.]